MKKSGLWTGDFTKITVATAFSIIAGEAMNLPISLLVFEKTQSTFLSALIMVLGVLPDLILGVLVAPIIDRSNKKKWIVGMDLVMIMIYAVMGLITRVTKFSFFLYAVFTLLVATDSLFYRLSYEAWYPELISKGNEQKGYSVSSTLYPLITLVMAPISTFLYEHISISGIFFIVCGVLLLAVFTEGSIKHASGFTDEGYNFKKWKRDIAEGFRYLKNEKGIRNIYTYQSFSTGVGEGVNVLTQAFYQTQPYLTVTMLGFLKSAEMLGRIFGGLVHYKHEFSGKKRYSITTFVYFVYQAADMILLFTPFPAMLGNRFAVGFLGTNSYTLRTTAVNNYMPAEIRARVNAFFEMMIAIGIIVFNLLAGALGQVMSYRKAILILGSFGLIAIIVLIVIPKKDVEKVYEK